LILDAGTGLRALGQKLARESGGQPKVHHVLLSHVHWDHIQGLPFFEPTYIPGTQIQVYALLTAADELQQVIGGITRHEFFPVPLDAAPAQIQYHQIEPGLRIVLGAFNVLPIGLNHPFGSVGYRIDADNTSVAYVADTAPFTDVLHKQHFLRGLEPLTEGDKHELDKMRAGLVAALRGVDTVVYDTHFFPDEYAKFPHYGHSTPEHAFEICGEAKVKRVILYHHAPSHSDDILDQKGKEYRAKGAALGLDVITSAEGMSLAIGAGP